MSKDKIIYSLSALNASTHKRVVCGTSLPPKYPANTVSNVVIMIPTSAKLDRIIQSSDHAEAIAYPMEHHLLENGPEQQPGLLHRSYLQKYLQLPRDFANIIAANPANHPGLADESIDQLFVQSLELHRVPSACSSHAHKAREYHNPLSGPKFDALHHTFCLPIITRRDYRPTMDSASPVLLLAQSAQETKNSLRRLCRQ